MANTSRYSIAKCCHDKTCPKCSYIGDAIVVNSGPHYTLYCSNCGAYIKHANEEDKRYTYVTHVKVEDLTPIKVAMLYVDSEKTMTTKVK